MDLQNAYGLLSGCRRVSRGQQHGPACGPGGPGKPLHVPALQCALRTRPLTSPCPPLAPLCSAPLLPHQVLPVQPREAERGGSAAPAQGGAGRPGLGADQAPDGRQHEPAKLVQQHRTGSTLGGDAGDAGAAGGGQPFCNSLRLHSAMPAAWRVYPDSRPDDPWPMNPAQATITNA